MIEGPEPASDDHGGQGHGGSPTEHRRGWHRIGCAGERGDDHQGAGEHAADQDGDELDRGPAGGPPGVAASGPGPLGGGVGGASHLSTVAHGPGLTVDPALA